VIIGLGLFFAFIAWSAWEWTRILVSVYQWLLKQPAFSRLCLSPTGSLPGEGDHDPPQRRQPNQYRSSQGRLLSSPVPARCTPDLESGGKGGA
jgi:hypothetical protein